MSDNIHVAVRIRPLIQRELESHANVLWDTKDSMVIYQKNSPSTEYCFDRVYNINDGNAFIYQDLCAPIVRSVMEGFNGTIFAYGQTSSGKTYTMMGEHGIIPSAIHEIFDAIDNMPDREFLLRVSYMEIYNENVLDLLNDYGRNLKTLEDNDGNIAVMGLSETEIKTSEEVFQIMQKGAEKRHVGDTKMNERSSRSHSIFRMIIESRRRNVPDEDSVVNVGQLNLVDLAGSERSAQMGMKGERLKEGKNINMSLLMLTQVISQLSQGSKHVSYRYSILTRILQNSLGGNARTVIVCTVTPASIQETLSTLNFASRAKRIKNKPTANIVSNDKALLKRYTSEIKKLSEKLEALQQMGDTGKKEILEKELEEKNKQNENLKRQIQELKEKFVVSQLPTDRPKSIISKKNRRETWCGGIGRKNNRFRHELLDPLPDLNEEPFDTNLFSNYFENDQRDRIPSFMSPPMMNFKFPDEKVNINVSIQTEITNEEDTDFKSLEEYNNLLSENSDQRIQIEDMSQQIDKLMAQINDLQSEPKSSNDDSSNFIEGSSPSNKLSIFDEIQMAEMKEYMNISSQTGNSLISAYSSEETTQTAVESQSDNDTQTEKQECFNKSAQFEHQLEDNMCQTEHFFEDNACQTECVTTMEAAVQVLNLYVESPKPDVKSDEESILCSNCFSKCTITETPTSALSVDNVKSINQVLDFTITSYQSAFDKFECITDKMNNLEFDQLEEQEDNELCFDAENELSQLMKEHFSVKYEEEINNLKCEIQNIKMDLECKETEIQHLKTLCDEKDAELKTVNEDLNHTRQEIWTKNNDLLNWQQGASEKYDMYLKAVNEKNNLEKQLKDIENATIKKEQMIEDMKMKAEAALSEYNQLKAELLETVKLLTTKNEEITVEKEHSSEISRLHQQDKEKLTEQIESLKAQVQARSEYCDKIVKDLKSDYEGRVLAIKNELKQEYEEKISAIRKELNDYHAQNMADEIEKLQIQMHTQASNFRLEKVKFEEQVLKSHRENGSALKLKNNLIKKEEECEKLKSVIEQMKHDKPNKDNKDLEKIIATKQRELEQHKVALSEIQFKLEASEKLLTDLKATKETDAENIQDLERKKLHLENLVKERESIIKQNNSKFNLLKAEFEKEYKKLKMELATSKQALQDEKSSAKSKLNCENKDAENDSGNLGKKDDKDIEKQFEINELQTRCKKLKEDNTILSRKLALCQNDVRRLYELQNESKIGKESPKLNGTDAAPLSNAQVQALLQQKEKLISRLEKENKKYQEYLKTKGHHRVVDEVSSTKQSVKKDNENKPPFSDTPVSTSLANKLQNFDLTKDYHPSKLKSVSPPQTKNGAPSSAMKRTAPYPLIGSQQNSAFSAVKPLSELQYDSQNCKQQ